MAAHFMTCRWCGRSFESTRNDARFDSSACRKAASRKARDLSDERFRAEAAALVADLQRALIAGDALELAEVDRRGRKLFGDGFPLAA